LYWIYRDGAIGAYGYNAIEGPFGILGNQVEILSLGRWHAGNRPVSESEVIAPSQMIAIGDSQLIQLSGMPANAASDITGSNVAPSPQDINPPPGATQSASTAATLRRHGGQWIMVFCDGHSEQGRGPIFFDWRSDEVLKRWNRDNRAHRQ
jgi:prepilin-type processing-associated H-X9-DG protein